MKLLVHLVPRRGAEGSVASQLAELGRALAARPATEVESVATMWRSANDPLGPNTPYAGALEVRVRGAGAARAEPLVELAYGLAARFGDAVHADLCTALCGREHVLIPAERAPVRFQYLMRRREGFSHAAYLERYRAVHAQFGLRTPGICGYVQVHVDPEATRAAARAAGFGGWGIDSVSELHLESIGDFLAAISSSTIGAEAAADEELFVDRAASCGFCSDVAWLAPADRG